MTADDEGRVLALSGGIGGAKLALGLCRVLGGARLSVLCNTGDDFRHLGLHVAPDIDTVVYTLAGLADPERGWGLAGETWKFMEMLGRIGGETWFSLGDMDLAMHVERTRRLDAGERLTAVTADLAQQLGVGARVLPMSDTPVPTIVETPDGPLAFQHYFVRDRAEPKVTGFEYRGAAEAAPSPALDGVLGDPDLDAIVICPSNPFISVDPVLSVGDTARRLRSAGAPVVAVSPVVGGRALKGPAAKMMAETGHEASALGIARRWRERWGDLVDGFVLDAEDAGSAPAVRDLGFRVMVAQTVMRSLDDRDELARSVLSFARIIREAEE